ncbi:uncharacterized protein LOC117113254 [Anneissia japonica]|uniref:uncharacterized protein LOC117113254 n=1 Tax=Anneissia japonica TaxID=1529436 RepID=UPI001425B6AE|nr:uncharacterized protein LOC117113254 [Anneissia japonica]XP_033112442.1 uncharacterized protein LOC117113254 [Anneissia japonica]
MKEDFQNKLLQNFRVISYDLSFFVINKISDTIFYDFANECNYTTVNSDFYNEVFVILEEELSSQMDTLIVSYTEAVQKFYPYDNYTKEHSVRLIGHLIKSLYSYVYPKMREMSVGVAENLYTTGDLGSLTYSYMQDNLARVDIYFESLNVEEIQEQKAYEVFAIMCDLGGALGLFFGASIVAFVEAIDFWFIRGCCGCKKKSID